MNGQKRIQRSSENDHNDVNRGTIQALTAREIFDFETKHRCPAFQPLDILTLPCKLFVYQAINFNMLFLYVIDLGILNRRVYFCAFDFESVDVLVFVFS